MNIVKAIKGDKHDKEGYDPLVWMPDTEDCIYRPDSSFLYSVGAEIEYILTLVGGFAILLLVIPAVLLLIALDTLFGDY